MVHSRIFLADLYPIGILQFSVVLRCTTPHNGDTFQVWRALALTHMKREVAACSIFDIRAVPAHPAVNAPPRLADADLSAGQRYRINDTYPTLREFCFMLRVAGTFLGLFLMTRPRPLVIRLHCIGFAFCRFSRPSWHVCYSSTGFRVQLTGRRRENRIYSFKTERGPVPRALEGPRILYHDPWHKEKVPLQRSL